MAKLKVKEIEIPHREWLVFIDERPQNVRKINGGVDMEAIEKYEQWVEELTQNARNFWVGKKVRFLMEERTHPLYLKFGLFEDVVFNEGEIHEITNVKLYHYADKSTTINYLQVGFEIANTEGFYKAIDNLTFFELFEIVD